MTINSIQKARIDSIVKNAGKDALNIHYMADGEGFLANIHFKYNDYETFIIPLDNDEDIEELNSATEDGLPYVNENKDVISMIYMARTSDDLTADDINTLIDMGIDDIPAYAD